MPEAQHHCHRLHHKAKPTSFALGQTSFSVFSHAKLARKGIGYGHNAGEERHNDTADVGVLCSAIDQVRDKRSNGKDHYDREEPNAADTGDRIEDKCSCCEELAVLKNGHNYGAESRKEHLPAKAASLTVSASCCVVIAVAGNAERNIVYKPERKVKKNVRNMACVECTNGCEAPESIVCKEDKVGEVYEAVGCYNYQYGKHDSAPHLALAELDSALFLVDNVNLMSGFAFALLVAYALSALLHNRDGTKTAKNAPDTDYAGCALKLDAKDRTKDRRADEAESECEKVKRHTPESGPDIGAPISLLCLAFKRGPRSYKLFRLEGSKVRNVEEEDCDRACEHKEAYYAEGIEECLNGPGLIRAGEAVGRAEGESEEFCAISYTLS